MLETTDTRRIQFIINSSTHCFDYKVTKMYKMHNKITPEQFMQQHTNEQPIILYCSLSEVASERNIPIQQLITQELSDLSNIRLYTNINSILSLQNNSIVLEVQAMIGQAKVLSDLSDQQYPTGYDSLLFSQPEQSQIYYKIADPSRILPINYIEIVHNISDPSKKLCQACLACFHGKLSRQEYFNLPASFKIDTQMAEPLSDVVINPQIASLYCENDNLCLCTLCDQLLHLSPLLQKHNRKPLDQRRVFDYCPIHNKKLQYFSPVSCKFYCSDCLNASELAEMIDVEKECDNVNWNEITCPEAKKLETQSTEILENLFDQIGQWSEKAVEQCLNEFKMRIRYIGEIKQRLQTNVTSQKLLIGSEISGINDKIALLKNNEETTNLNKFIGALYAWRAGIQEWSQQFAKQTFVVASYEQLIQQELNQLQPSLEQLQQEVERLSSSRIYGVYGKAGFTQPIRINGIQQQLKMDNTMLNQGIQSTSIPTMQTQTQQPLIDLISNVPTSSIYQYQAQANPLYDKMLADEKKDMERKQELLREQQRQEELKQMESQQQALEKSKQYDVSMQQPNINASQWYTNQTNMIEKQLNDKKNDIFSKLFNNNGEQLTSGLNLQQTFQLGDFGANQTIQAEQLYQTVEQTVKQDQLQQSVAFTQSQAVQGTQNMMIQQQEPQQEQQIQQQPQQQQQDQQVNVLSATYAHIRQKFKFDQKNIQLPDDTFKPLTLTSEQQQILLALSAFDIYRTHHFNKLKLIIPFNIFNSAVNNLSFNNIYDKCQGKVSAICVEISSPQGEIQVLVMMFSIAMQLGDNEQGKLWNMKTGEEYQGVQIGKNEIRVADKLFIGKDFSYVEYQGKLDWSIERVEVFQWLE